jgi:hypothetical protein
MDPSATTLPTHIQAVTVMGLTALLGFTLRTSAAAAAAVLGSSAPSLPPAPPTVRPGPVTFGFALDPPALATCVGMEALVAGAGADSKVRPAPWKLSSLDDLPQRLPMVGGRRCGVGEWAPGGGDRRPGWARGPASCSLTAHGTRCEVPGLHPSCLRPPLLLLFLDCRTHPAGCFWHVDHI